MGTPGIWGELKPVCSHDHVWSQVTLLWQLLSLQERLNTKPSYMQSGPAVGLP